jgi:hypothetical protein
MSLREIIAESETEYKYRVYSTAPIHGGAELAAIRVGLAGRMARDIKPAGILPWLGTKSDRFPEVPFRPVYVVDLTTGIPLSLKNAVRELSFALQVAQDKIIIDGEDREPAEAPKPEKPYQKDGITPSMFAKDITAETPMQSLQDLLKDLGDGKGHLARDEGEVKPVYEGYTVTQIEAELLLNDDLSRGYYVVQQIAENQFDIIGPLVEIPENCPLDLDRNNGLVLKEMNYDTSRYVSVRVQDTDTGKEYPILVQIEPGMPEDQIRNMAVQQVAVKHSIPDARLIAMDPNRNMIPGARAATRMAA